MIPILTHLLAALAGVFAGAAAMVRLMAPTHEERRRGYDALDIARQQRQFHEWMRTGRMP